MHDEFENLLSGVLSESEARRFTHFTMVADVEDHLVRLENKIWLAVEQSCADGEPNKHVALLRRLAEIRAEANVMWAEIQGPGVLAKCRFHPTGATTRSSVSLLVAAVPGPTALADRIGTNRENAGALGGDREAKSGLPGVLCLTMWA